MTIERKHTKSKFEKEKDKITRNFLIGLFLFIIVLAGGLTYIFYSNHSNKEASQAILIKNTTKKIKAIESLQFNIVCEKKIYKKYKLVKVDTEYYIFFDGIKTLDEAYPIDKCKVIYEIKG